MESPSIVLGENGKVREDKEGILKSITVNYWVENLQKMKMKVNRKK